MKMWRENLFLISALVLVSSHIYDGREESSRKARLFTFNTVDDNIRVDLELTIPFITIPVKTAADSVYGLWSGVPTININPATLAVGGAIILGTTVLLPFVMKSYASQHPFERYSRIIDSTQFSSDAVLEFASQMLADGRSVRGCALRIACWTAQRNNIEANRFWQQVKNNRLVTTVINSTAIDDAILSGRKGRDCETYSPCPLSEEHIRIILNSFGVSTNSLGYY